MSGIKNRYLREDGIHDAPYWRIIGFAGVNVAVNLYMGLTMYMSYYLNGFVGMAVILASSFSTIMRLWDGVTDPLVGFFVDRFGSKIGKTRFCIIAGTVLLSFNSFLMFNVTHRLPEGGLTRSIFFTFFALLFYIGYTFLNVSCYTGGVCITNDPKKRPVGSIVGSVFVRLMRSVMSIVVAGLAAKYGSMSDVGLFMEFWRITCILALICAVISYISIAPKDIPLFNEVSSKKKVKIKFSDYLDTLKHNRPLQMMVIAQATDKFATCGKTSAITVVLYGIIVGNFKLSGGWSLYTTIIGLVIMTLGIGGIGRKLGLKKAMVTGSWGVIILDVLSVLLWTLGDPKTLNLPGYTNGYGQAFSGFTFFTIALFLLTVIGGGCQMICSSVVQPMLADVNDYEASRSGKYIPGMVGTLFSFMDKMISSFAPLLVGVGFSMIGFKDKLPDVNTPYSVNLFILALFFFYGLEIIGSIFNVIAMKYYNLTPEKMKEVQKKVYEMRIE